MEDIDKRKHKKHKKRKKDKEKRYHFRPFQI